MPQPLVVTMQIPEAISREYLEHHRVLPLRLENGRLTVAVAGEPDPQALDDLALLFGATVEVHPVPDDELTETIRRALDSSMSLVGMVSHRMDDQSGPAADPDLLADVRDLANQPPVVRYVSLLVREAHNAGASDIHLEATPQGLRARLRLDGVLTDTEAPPHTMAAAVISRVKLLAELDIAEQRVPQDGRIRARLEEHELDLRVSTLPSLHGESLVLRLLDRAGQQADLDTLGMDPDTHQAVRSLALLPHGIVLVTGPTGSGKTTTLHAALGLRNTAVEKVVTVEDPVEYQLPGVTQVPINLRAGVTFASALRSVLRQDPDVVMIGEMRDEETASIAVRSALTGHLVLSTLHTNDTISAVARLHDLGVDDYLVASTLEGVLAQRLVRKVCPDCSQRAPADPQTVALLAGRPVGTVELARGAGCPACRNSGYRGRTGLFELLRLDETLKDLVTTGAARSELREHARRLIPRTLRQDGWLKVQAGLTTVEEVLRVTSH